MRIALVARTDLEHEGSIIPAGVRFDAEPIAAAVLCYQHKAAFAPPGVIAPVPVPAVVPPEPELPVPPRRRGRRRASGETETADPPTPPRRRYRRRDLTVE